MFELSYLCDFVHAVTDPGRDGGHYEPISPIALWWSEECEFLSSAFGGHGRLTLKGPMTLDMVGSHTQFASSSVGLNNYSMGVVTEGFAIGVAMMVHLQLSLWKHLSLLE